MINPYLKVSLWLFATTLMAGVTVAQGVDWDHTSNNDIAKIVLSAIGMFATQTMALFNMLETKKPEDKESK